MLRKTWVLLVLGLGLALGAGQAQAGGTIDLLWMDNGQSTLQIAPLDLAGTGCGGFNNPNANQVGTRCLQVVFTVDEGFIIQSHSVTWASKVALLPNLTALYATQFISSQIGKTDYQSLGAPGIDNQSGLLESGVGTISSFTMITPPPNHPPAIPPGTYFLGTIVWNTQTLVAPTTIEALFLPGDVFGNAVAGNASGNITFNSALITFVPEPGTASLVGLGLIGMVVGARRRQKRGA